MLYTNRGLTDKLTQPVWCVKWLWRHRQTPRNGNVLQLDSTYFPILALEKKLYHLLVSEKSTNPSVKLKINLSNISWQASAWTWLNFRFGKLISQSKTENLSCWTFVISGTFNALLFTQTTQHVCLIYISKWRRPPDKCIKYTFYVPASIDCRTY